MFSIDEFNIWKLGYSSINSIPLDFIKNSMEDRDFYNEFDGELILFYCGDDDRKAYTIKEIAKNLISDDNPENKKIVESANYISLSLGKYKEGWFKKPRYIACLKIGDNKLNYILGFIPAKSLNDIILKIQSFLSSHGLNASYYKSFEDAFFEKP